MQFYNPNILYGLFALIIPIIIHLFNFKRFKKVYFTNVAFLKNVQQQSKRHSQLRHLFIMLLRMLFIASIVFAFAGPFIPSKDNVKAKSQIAFVNVFLDNSFSMEARGSEGSLFEQARLIARQIADAYKPSDKFRLLVNNAFSFSRNYVSRDAFIDQLEYVSIDKSSLIFDEIPLKITDTKESGKYQELYIISDFQKKQSNFSSWQNDSLLDTKLVLLMAANQGNRFVDSVWIQEPILQQGQNIDIFFEIINQSESPVEDLAVSLFIGKRKKSVLSVNIDAFGSVKASFKIKLDSIGFFDARINIEDYPVVYDDDFYFSYTVQQAYDVLCIASENANTDLNILLESDSSFKAEIVSEKHIDYSNFSKYSTIILNSLSVYPSGLLSELKQFMSKGNTVVVLPSANINIEDFNIVNNYFGLPLVNKMDSSKRNMQKIDLLSSEFNDIFEAKNGRKAINSNTDLPYFKNTFLSQRSRKADINELIFDETKHVLLYQKYIEGGSLYSFYTSIESRNSNISSHAVFVPIMYNIIRRVNSTKSVFEFLGKESKTIVDVGLASSSDKLLMKHYNDSIEFIPQYGNFNGQLLLNFEQNPSTVGSYGLLLNGVQKAVYSFNYNRDESFLNYFSIGELKEIISNLSIDNITIIDTVEANIVEKIEEVNNGIKLWKLFVIFALFFLIFELFLLRYSK